MNKSEILNTIKERTNITKSQAELVLNTFSDLVRNEDRIAWPGLGIFKKKTRHARTARNPITGEPVSVPEKTVIVFKPSK